MVLVFGIWDAQGSAYSKLRSVQLKNLLAHINRDSRNMESTAKTDTGWLNPEAAAPFL